MHPRIQAKFVEIIRTSGVQPGRALEVGGYVNEKSLLLAPELEGADRYCLNLNRMRTDTAIKPVVGNSNEMRMFEDASFDLVLSNATLEHDKYFWRSLAEIRRVTRPGGLVILGVPGYTKGGPVVRPRGTVTFAVHYRFDYYRFSEQAVRDVFFEGMEEVGVFPMLVPPRIIGHGRKPASSGDGSSATRSPSPRRRRQGPAERPGEAGEPTPRRPADAAAPRPAREALAGVGERLGSISLRPVFWQARVNRLIAPTGFELRRARRHTPRRKRGARALPIETTQERLLVAPVFILASIRSGSTLLRVLLNSHSQLHAPHELHLRNVNVHVSGDYAVQAMWTLGLDEAALEYLLWDRVLHRELERSGKKYIVNKTPTDVFMAGRIAECWPDARFIFLLRHPLAIARSRQRGNAYGDRRNLARVLRFMNALEKARQDLDGLTVRYEDLTAAPAGVTQRVCELIGVEWEPEMLDYGRVDHGKHSPGLGDWGSRIRSGQIHAPRPLPAGVGVPEELRDLCAAWGYARDVLPAE
ncbi:MAG: sulfotransferase [Actinomycetota bacterium]